jgi:integrase
LKGTNARAKTSSHGKPAKTIDLCPAQHYSEESHPLRLTGELCQGEHGISKEACNARNGEAVRMFGFFDGVSWVLTGRASNARPSLERSIALRLKHLPSKPPMRCASTQTNKPRRQKAGPTTIAELVAHYRLKELVSNSSGRKAFSTRAAYECYLNTWILPRWGDHRLDQIKPVAVEEWLDGIKRARGTKAKMRNLMSALFHHAMRYEWVDKNPIKLVRQSAKRERIPEVLELTEIQLLLSKLGVRERTLALLAAGTGLRVSELLALRWQDMNFDNLELNVTRSIWHQVVGNCKTEASAKPVPLDSYMAEDLLRWRRQSSYPREEDFIFASETMKGEQPFWPDNLMKRYLRPVARANGIYKNIGWHTFRHTYGTLLKANGKM